MVDGATAGNDAGRAAADAAYRALMVVRRVAVTGGPGGELLLCEFGGGRPNLSRTG